MNQHSDNAHRLKQLCDQHPNVPALRSSNDQLTIHHRLFLQTHALAHQRLKAAYQRLHTLLAAEQEQPTTEPSAYLLIEQLHHRVSQLRAVFLAHARQGHLSCSLIHSVHAQACDPYSIDFAKRFRFEYANHLFLRQRHRLLKKHLCVLNDFKNPQTEQPFDLSSRLQEVLAQADAANEKGLIAFEGYRKIRRRT